jgi:predicted ATPase
LKILATSRESLRIAGEWRYPVPAFDIPEETSSINLESASNFPAITLFTERARAVQPDFILNAENIQTVSAICAHLDGLPLVIELIAARMRLMSPEALLQRLSDQFILTADGMRAASEHQKTLSNAIEWSYNLLSAEEQKLFAHLSVFSGSFTLEDAQSIFSQIVKSPISNLITSLLDKSLLQRVSNQEINREPRYTMLVTIQEFARQRLQSNEERKKIRDKHLAYFLDVARKAYQELYGRQQVEWLNRLSAARDNFRVALDWAIETRQTETALQVVRGLHWFWLIRSHHSEARQWFQRVLEMPDAPLYSEAYAEVLAQLAHHISLQIRARDAQPLSEQSLSIARASKDKHNTARALWVLAMALTAEKNFEAAQSALEESQALFREVQDEWGYAMAVFILGWLVYWQENWPTALTLMEEALAIYSQLGDRYLMSVILNQIGKTCEKQGNVADGEAATKEALVLAQQVDSKYEIANDLWSLGDLAQHAKRWIRAMQLYSAGKKVYDSVGAWQPEDDKNWEERLRLCRAALLESEMADAVEEGRAMTMEQAIAYALESRDV